MNCSNTNVSSCLGLRDLINLEYLDISNTQIDDIQCISRINSLTELNISQTSIAAISVLGATNIDIIYADESGVDLKESLVFKQKNPDCVIVYQTAELEQWWAALNSDWQAVFTSAEGIKSTPGPKDLQRMADLTEIDLEQRKKLGTLAPLQKLYLLRSLKMDHTQISDLEPIESSFALETLIISDNPIEDISHISGLNKLKQLEFENTPVSDLRPLIGLIKIEILNMAGTQIKKLNEISELRRLREISFYNTSVKSLTPLESLISLEVIKCYNTKLNAKKVSKFAGERPACEVIFY